MKKHIFTFFFLFFSAISFAQEPPVFDSSDASIPIIKIANYKCDSAVLYRKMKNEKAAKKFYKEAIAGYKKAVAVTPTSFQGYYKMALAQTAIQDYKNAILSFNKAISIDDKRSDVFRDRGIAYYEQNNFDSAKSNYDKAILINFDDYEAFYRRGLLKEKGKDPTPAFADYERVLELAHKHEGTLLRRGMLYHNFKKDYVLALLDFNKLVEVNPESNEAYLWKIGRAHV